MAVSEMYIENFYMAVGMILPEFHGIFAANMDVQRAFGDVTLQIVGKFLRLVTNGHEAIPQNPLFTAGKRFQKLNDRIVNEQTIIHCPFSEKPSRRSKSAKVANLGAGWSIFS